MNVRWLRPRSRIDYGGEILFHNPAEKEQGEHVEEEGYHDDKDRDNPKDYKPDGRVVPGQIYRLTLGRSGLFGVFQEILNLQNISTKRHEEVCFYSRRAYIRCLRYDQ